MNSNHLPRFTANYFDGRKYVGMAVWKLTSDTSYMDYDSRISNPGIRNQLLIVFIPCNTSDYRFVNVRYLHQYICLATMNYFRQNVWWKFLWNRNYFKVEMFSCLPCVIFLKHYNLCSIIYAQLKLLTVPVSAWISQCWI